MPHATFFDGIGDLDEPFTLSHGFTNALVYDAAKQNGCRVVLEGMAGDLLFYGLDRSMSVALRAGMLSQDSRAARRLPPARDRWRTAGAGAQRRGSAGAGTLFVPRIAACAASAGSGRTT